MSKKREASHIYLDVRLSLRAAIVYVRSGIMPDGAVDALASAIHRGYREHGETWDAQFALDVQGEMARNEVRKAENRARKAARPQGDGAVADGLEPAP